MDRTWIALFMFVLSVAASAQAPAGPPASQPVAQAPRTCYVAFLDLGPKYNRALPPLQQPGIREHGAYMMQLTRDGKLLVGGPFVEKPGSTVATSAIMILAADSMEDARNMLQADPGRASGLFSVADIKPLMITGGAWPLAARDNRQ